MSRNRYTIGVDFGTESARAVLVDVADGTELATAVHECANGVIDERLPEPDQDVVLEHDWALQDPADYMASFKDAVPRVLTEGKTLRRIRATAGRAAARSDQPSTAGVRAH